MSAKWYEFEFEFSCLSKATRSGPEFEAWRAVQWSLIHSKYFLKSEIFREVSTEKKSKIHNIKAHKSKVR